MLRIAFSPVYKYELPEGHRFPMDKYELIPEQLLYEGTVIESQFFHPAQLTDAQILLTHTEEYYKKLTELDLTRKEIRDIGFPVLKSLIERGKYIAKGTYDCAIYAIKHGVSMNVAGGTHHAFADHGEGFCVFNDFAIAANLLMSENLVKKILIIDLDVHQGNGTAKIFENDDRVFTFSVHGERNYPLRKEQSDLDVGLPDKCGDQLYLQSVKKHIPKLFEQVEPDLVLYLSGVDILETDKLGRLSVSKQGCKQRDEFVLKECKRNDVPVAISMGGGYSEKISDIIEAHANTFRVAQDLYF